MCFLCLGFDDFQLLRFSDRGLLENSSKVAPISYYKTHVLFLKKTHVLYFTQTSSITETNGYPWYELIAKVSFYSYDGRTSILCNIVVIVIQAHAYLDASISYRLRSFSFLFLFFDKSRRKSNVTIFPHYRKSKAKWRILCKYFII